jgi:hypothetical protein
MVYKKIMSYFSLSLLFSIYGMDNPHTISLPNRSKCIEVEPRDTKSTKSKITSLYEFQQACNAVKKVPVHRPVIVVEDTKNNTQKSSLLSVPTPHYGTCKK